MKNFFSLLLILVIALSLRLYGLNWDQGQHLHPDERFLTMVATDIKMPSSISQYFDTAHSPLNPYNYQNYKFFVYGTLPLFLVKTIAVGLDMDNYDKIVLVGRTLSAIFDSIIVVLLFALSRKLFTKGSKIIFVPSLLYAFCVLPLQLSHFYTVDTFLSTYIFATFVLLSYGLFLPAAITFGLALACKVSAIYFVPIFICFLLFSKFTFYKKILIGLLALLVCLATFRIFQPYSFIDLYRFNPDFIASLRTLVEYTKLDGYYPPGVQWLSIGNPLLFALKNIVLWGLGLPVAIGLFLSLKFTKNKIIILAIAWVLILFIYQGLQTNPTMRYFLPIYPFVVVVFAYFSHTKRYTKYIIGAHIIAGLLFINIYSHSHTRVDASQWIYKNILPGKTITNEYWDDPLPLNISPNSSSVYNGLMISPYDPDSSEKISKLYTQVNSASYIVMSSNRLWHSIPFAPKFYPLTSKYYEKLFNNELNFKKVLELNSYPGIRLPLGKCYYFGPTNFPGLKNNWFEIDSSCLYPGIYLRDDTAEEAFTVYDHPKVLIFQNSFSN